MKWQQIGNRKSASQNNICNRNKITAKKDTRLKQIHLRTSLDLPSLNNEKNLRTRINSAFEGYQGSI